jgi:hypothetical protein
MYNLKIDEESASALMRQMLQEDYIGICMDTERLSKKAVSRDLETFESEDLAECMSFKAAFETLFNYFLTEEERKKIIKD